MSRRGRPAELPEGSSVVLHDFSRWLSSVIYPVLFRLRVLGREHVPAHGPVVLVANHSAFVDGPLLYGLLRRRIVFLVKHEMFTGFLGWALVKLGQLPVRRGEPDRTPLLTAVRLLRAGGVVAVFPEGTRGEGDVLAAHHGAAWLARSTGAVVLPVACRGTRRPGAGGRRFRPRVDIVVGKPFTVPATKGRAALADATEHIRLELTRLLGDLDGSRVVAPPRRRAGRSGHGAS